MAGLLKFALIGCGRIAQRHAEQINRVGVLEAVCDIIPERAEQLSKKYNTKAYTAIEKLLSEEKSLDIVVICTPNGLHAEHSIKAMEAGFHVLCEKPMAITVSDCKRMIEAGVKSGKQLYIVKQNRFNPPVVAVRKLVDNKVLGRIFSIQVNCFWNRDAAYYSDWHGTKDMDGGTLFTQFSHFIDLMYWLMGDVKRAEAITGNFTHKGIIEFEDTGAVVLEFGNGAIGTLQYTVSSVNKNMEGSVTIFAEHATIKIGGEYLNTLEYVQGVEIKDLPSGSVANDYGRYKGSMSNHDKVYDLITSTWDADGVIPDNSNDGLKTVEIIEKIYLSAGRG